MHKIWAEAKLKMYRRWLLITRTATTLALLRVVGPLWPGSRAARERRAARRIARTLAHLGGLYTRLGQHLAQRPGLLPDPVREELAPLAEAGERPFYEILEQLQRGLGGAAGRFTWIDPHPEGGSLVQAHRAKLLDGPQVTIKVCPPGLAAASAERHARKLRRVLRLFRRWLGRAERRALLQAFAGVLRDELDLDREAALAESLAESFEDDPRIVVPAVHWELSGPGVLTLQHVPGVSLDDRIGRARLGAGPEECQALVCEAYGRLVLQQGQFHPDARSGDLYLVDEDDPRAPAGLERPRIVFMDFGLTGRLSDGVREDLRRGLQALLARDVEGVVAALDGIGALGRGRRKRATRAIREALEAGAGEGLTSDRPDLAPLARLARQLVAENGALRAPEELRLYADTLAHMLALARTVAPDSDPAPRLLPHALKFLSPAA